MTLTAIEKARRLLETKTPLKTDCGRLCSTACCKGDADGQGGMLLFPGEEALYAPAKWFTIETYQLPYYEKPVGFFTCDGTCDRALRPLACRIFPLFPLIGESDDAFTLSLDARAWPVCPLMEHGMEALDPRFVLSVYEAMLPLSKDAEGRAFLFAVSRQIEGYTSLLKGLRWGDGERWGSAPDPA